MTICKFTMIYFVPNNNFFFFGLAMQGNDVKQWVDAVARATLSFNMLELTLTTTSQDTTGTIVFSFDADDQCTMSTTNGSGKELQVFDKCRLQNKHVRATMMRLLQFVTDTEPIETPVKKRGRAQPKHTIEPRMSAEFRGTPMQWTNVATHTDIDVIVAFID